MTTIFQHEKTSECEACTLAEVMKDCEHCRNAQGLDAPTVTSKEVFDMYRRLWGDFTPQDIYEAARLDPTRELVDMTQVPQWVITD